jgi:hypothetical protein
VFTIFSEPETSDKSRFPPTVCFHLVLLYQFVQSRQEKKEKRTCVCVCVRACACVRTYPKLYLQEIGLFVSCLDHTPKTEISLQNWSVFPILYRVCNFTLCTYWKTGVISYDKIKNALEILTVLAGKVLDT